MVPIEDRKKRGVFILFEGVDRCGKTTQSQLLTKYLNEKTACPTELIRFPARETTIGQIIDSYLKSQNDLNDHSIHLLFSANRWERKKVIEESLAEGKSFVSLQLRSA
jgi:dTMP kinase